MKFICIILLVCFSTSNAQEFESKIISLYDEYAKECYNDSTLIITRDGLDINIPTIIDSLGRKTIDMSQSFNIPAIYIVKKEWVHKEPTLSGFIEFIKKKVKKSN